MTTSFGNEFIETAIKRVLYYKSLGEKTIHQLNDDQLNDSCGAESNSIAVIIQHLSGNMLSRWTNFLTEDGEKPWRQRDDEFEIHAFNKIQLIEIWAKGWDCFIGELRSLTENDLTKTVYIRQEPLTVTDAIIRQLAHYPYHIGQMVYIGRLLKKEDWINLSIPRGQSNQYNQSDQTKDPTKNFK
ncbi:MAG: DUF1572 family protein [Chitinophagaceae bacterium]